MYQALPVACPLLLYVSNRNCIMDIHLKLTSGAAMPNIPSKLTILESHHYKLYR